MIFANDDNVENKRAYIYAHSASPKQYQGKNYQYQIDNCLDYAKQNNIMIIDICIELCKSSGEHKKRDALIEKAKEKDVYIICSNARDWCWMGNPDPKGYYSKLCFANDFGDYLWNHPYEEYQNSLFQLLHHYNLDLVQINLIQNPAYFHEIHVNYKNTSGEI